MNELKIPTNLETISLNEQTNYRLIEINRIKNYFESEIREQREMIRRLSKYITGLDYADKILTAYLGKNKADSVEMLISQAIIDLDISHEKFKAIIDEKKIL